MICSRGDVSGTHWIHRQPDPEPWSRRLGSLLRQRQVPLEPTVTASPDAARGEPRTLEKTDVLSRALWKHLPVPGSPWESDVTVNKAFHQLTWALKWLGLASTEEDASSSTLCCAN